MGCRPMPNDVLLRSGTKGALILRYDDDGYSAVFSEILHSASAKEQSQEMWNGRYVPAGSRSVMGLCSRRAGQDQLVIAEKCPYHHNPLRLRPDNGCYFPAKKGAKVWGSGVSGLHSSTTLVPSCRSGRTLAVP